MKDRGSRSAFALSAAVLAVMFLLALCLGRYSVNPADVLGAVLSRVSGTTHDPAMENILFRVRLPRATAAVLIGAALSLSGAAYQSVMRNPLVSPDLLGVSSGAAFGASLAIFFGLSGTALQVFAFSGGIAAVLLAASLPRILRNSSNMMLVLSGIIVSGFMNALIGIIKYVSREQDQLSSIVFWQMGSLSRLTVNQLFSAAPPIILSLALMISLSWRLNILSFGEVEAKTVGVDTVKLRGVIIVCASLLTASSVCISGTIGWIGLVIPHLGRLISGSDNTKLMPVAAVLGGAFLLFIDTMARCLTQAEIPLSILSGLAGAPFYMWLLCRQRAKIF